ncbi:MAG: hypothetical protein OEV73_04765 [Desulfobulbaceae bacterium]|nr:hypothetical protein [Desulfobulbaceae bacterium]
MNGEQEAPKEFDSKLLPILREAVEVVRMILFKELKEHLAATYPERRMDAGRLAAAVLNDLFGVVNPDPVYATFMAENRAILDQALADLPTRLPKLLIPLTDALRMQFLCDSREGLDESTAFLVRAKERGLLLEARELPLPHHFLELVRRLGAAYGLVLPPTPPADAPLPS